MIVVSVEFLHRTFRGDPDGTAITGNQLRGEWPPSPARLFSAFVAADGTRDISRVTSGKELEWMESLPPPVIYAQSHPSHQGLHPRFVVEHSGRAVKNTHQEYVARKGTQYREGVKIALSDPKVVYSWTDSAQNENTMRALARRAARIGYLGTSDSPVRIRVSDHLPNRLPSGKWTPDPNGNTRIGVPRKGDLETLDRLFDAWTDHGSSISRAQFSTLNHRTRYRSSGKQENISRGGVLIWLRVLPALSGRRISDLTMLFKKAVLSCYQRVHGEPPNVLHGHGYARTGYEIARYLALPDVGSQYSRGRIHGLALWLPPDIDQVRSMRIRDAVLSIDRLVGTEINVTVEENEVRTKKLWSTNPQRWQGPAKTWITAFPVIHERYGAATLEEAKRWCRNAGLAEPCAFFSSRTPLVPGAVDLSPTEVNRSSRDAKPYSHAVFQFKEPISGPIVVGAGRQRGFGLCVPIT